MIYCWMNEYRTDMEIKGLDRLKNVIDSSLEREVSDYTDDNMSEKDWDQRKWTEGTYINCDLRYYNLASLGKFDVVLVDPPWYLIFLSMCECESLHLSHTHTHTHALSLHFFHDSISFFLLAYQTQRLLLGEFVEENIYPTRRQCSPTVHFSSNQTFKDWRMLSTFLLISKHILFNHYWYTFFWGPFSLEYNTLSVEEIMDIDVGVLSDRGFIFLWTINSQLQAAFECLNKWGYTYLDRVSQPFSLFLSLFISNSTYEK